MKKILFSTALILHCILLQAQWDANPASVNTPVITTVSDESSNFAIPDGANGSIIVTQSYNFINSPFTSDITAQKISTDGLLQWGTATNPKSVFSSSNENEYLSLNRVISDGSGGAFIAWQSYIDTFSNIYIQHINSSGDKLWAATGIKINHNNNRSSNINQICLDALNGVVMVWDENIYDSATDLTTFSQSYAQRINSAGTIQWGANGVQVCTAAGLRGGANLINDGNGGFIICFADSRNSTQLPGDIFNNLDIYAQRLDINGALTWATNGLPIVTAALNQTPTGGFLQGNNSISDGANGALLLFDQFPQDSINGNEKSKYYAQRINGSGAIQWGASGVLFCNIDSSKQLINMVSDGAGGLVAAWGDGRNYPAQSEIYAQRILSNGTVNWATNGVKVLPLTDAYNFWETKMTDDGTGNYLFTWQNHSNPYGEIKAQKINNSGVTQWGASAKPVCTNTQSNPSSPSIVKSISGSAIINWIDSRNGFMNFTDIYAAKIASNGSLIGTSSAYITNTNGNWNMGSTWIGGVVPPSTADVIIRHDVKVTANASCKAISVEKPNGKITVNTGFNLVVLQ